MPGTQARARGCVNSRPGKRRWPRPDHRAIRRGRGRALDTYGGPPRHLAEYLAAEQGLRRIRPDVDTTRAAVVLLATLSGSNASPLTAPGPVGEQLTAEAVTLFLDGVAQPSE